MNTWVDWSLVGGDLLACCPWSIAPEKDAGWRSTTAFWMLLGFQSLWGWTGPSVQVPLRRLGKLWRSESFLMKASWKGFCCELLSFLKVPGMLQSFMILCIGPCRNMSRWQIQSRHTESGQIVIYLRLPQDQWSCLEQVGVSWRPFRFWQLSSWSNLSQMFWSPLPDEASNLTCKLSKSVNCQHKRFWPPYTLRDSQKC